MKRVALWGIACLALSGCGGGDDEGKGNGNGGLGCKQVPTCVPDLTRAIRSICVDDACVEFGRKENGQVVLSDVYLYTFYPVAVSNYQVQGYTATVFHPLRPDGSRLTCADVLALEPEQRRGAGYTNVVKFTSGRLLDAAYNDVFPATLYGMPASEPGESYLVLSEMWSGTPEAATGLPRGAIIAEGCAEGLVALPGAYVSGDETHTFRVEAQLAVR